MNVFQDNVFDFRLQGELTLHYCGKRRDPVNHRYVHRQNAYLITYVCEGEATLSVNRRRLLLHEGDVYVMFPASGASYVTAPHRPWSIRWVTVTGTQLETLLPLLGFTEEMPVHRVAEPERVESLLEALFYQAMKADVAGKIAGMAQLYEFFSCLAPRAAAPIENHRIADVVGYINRHYAEELTVSILAERAHLNRNYFSKLFTTHVGMTPQRFLSRLRMEKAKELLRYTELMVGEIAAAVGITDALYFSRTFKRYTGYSPSEYRYL